MIDAGIPGGNPYETIIYECPCDVSTTVIAKDYGFSAVAFNKILMQLQVQYRAGSGWALRSDYVGHDYTHHSTYYLNSGKMIISRQWTQRGRLFLYELLKKHGYRPLIEMPSITDRQLSIADC